MKVETKTYNINIDGRDFEHSRPSATGAQLKALVGKDAQYDLMQDSGKREWWLNKKIDDLEAVCLTGPGPIHFYTVPRWCY